MVVWTLNWPQGKAWLTGRSETIAWMSPIARLAGTGSRTRDTIWHGARMRPRSRVGRPPAALTGL